MEAKLLVSIDVILMSGLLLSYWCISYYFAFFYSVLLDAYKCGSDGVDGDGSDGGDAPNLTRSPASSRTAPATNII